MLYDRQCYSQVFDRLKYRVTTTSGGGATLYDVIAAGVENLDTPIGVFAPDPNTYRTFWPLLKPVISTWHRVQNNRSLIQPSVNWGDLGRFDTSGGFDRKYVRSYQFRIARQVIEYPCVPKMNAEQLRRLEREMAARLSTVFDEPEEDENDFEGVYEGLADINKASRIKVRTDCVGKIIKTGTCFCRSRSCFPCVSQWRVMS